jgi:hypothetical protein
MKARTQARRWSLMLGIAAALAGMTVALLAIRLGSKGRETFTQELCDRIKVGMTWEEVHDILGDRRWSLCMKISPTDLPLYIFRCEDGTTISVTFGRDQLVSSDPTYQESQETAWDRLELKARNAFPRLFPTSPALPAVPAPPVAIPPPSSRRLPDPILTPSGWSSSRNFPPKQPTAGNRKNSGG